MLSNGESERPVFCTRGRSLLSLLLFMFLEERADDDITPGDSSCPAVLATCGETIAPTFLAQAAGPDERNKTTAIPTTSAAAGA